jgi:hypothetical protein
MQEKRQGLGLFQDKYLNSPITTEENHEPELGKTVCSGRHQSWAMRDALLEII